MIVRTLNVVEAHCTFHLISRDHFPENEFASGVRAYSAGVLSSIVFRTGALATLISRTRVTPEL
jgi:hypothetical protein